MSLLTINLITGHSVMRTCAHVSISDCKTANGVQYCYCAFQDCYQACNSLDRHLAPVVQGGEGSSSRLGKEVRGGKEHKEEVDKVERKALGFTSAAHSPPAFASQYPAGHFTDDEVNIFSASITITAMLSLFLSLFPLSSLFSTTGVAGLGGGERGLGRLLLRRVQLRRGGGQHARRHRGQLRPRGVAARRLFELRGLPSNLWSSLTLRPAGLSKPNNANISSTGRISRSSKAEQSPKCAPTGPRPPEVCVRGAGRTGSWAKIRTYICGSSIKSHLKKEVYVGHYYYRTYFLKFQCQRLANI